MIYELAWPVRGSMPLFAYDVSHLQQSLPEATVLLMVQANSVLKAMQEVTSHNAKLTFPAFPSDQQLVIGVQSDASFNNMPKGGSQSGFAVFVASECLCDESVSEVSVGMLDWGSHRIKRVVKSTLAAEAAAFSSAYDKAIYCRVVLGEILHGPTTEWEQQLTVMKSVAASDCRSLTDFLEKDTGMPSEKRVALDLYDLKQYVLLGDQYEWVPTGLTIVDAFTKKRPWQGPLLEAMIGRVKWRETAAERLARRTGKDRHKRKECTVPDADVD